MSCINSPLNPDIQHLLWVTFHNTDGRFQPSAINSLCN